MSPAERLAELRRRFATKDAPPTGKEGLTREDIERLAELPATDPDEKTRELERIWQRLHGG